MIKLQFSTHIIATKERVWDILWNPETYPAWTQVFSEGSQMKADWREGGKVLFVDQSNEGMSSEIATLIPYQRVSFRHLGFYKNGAEDRETAQKEGWSDALETYTLTEKDGGILLAAELETNNIHADYFEKTFPQALKLVKELAGKQLITPFLWFNDDMEPAMQQYTTAFANSAVLQVNRQGDRAFTASFSLGGQKFSAINGGPSFRFTPATSLFVQCETEAEVDHLWGNLSEGGKTLMPLQAWPWSEKYGWLEDRFGLSWQISLGKLSDVGQKITPALLFVDAQNGRAEAAMQRYLSVFNSNTIDGILYYGPGQPNTEGFVQHAQFALAGQKMMVTDGGTGHNYTFNEAFSLVISTETQEETDHYWTQLTRDGGEESQCAWLKDPFGVSWQVVPKALMQYLSDPDASKAGSVMQAMLKMRKIDISLLQNAYESTK